MPWERSHELTSHSMGALHGVNPAAAGYPWAVPEATLSPALVRAEALIRNVPDYPQPGIIFRDITPLLADEVLSNSVIEDVVGIEVAE